MKYVQTGFSLASLATIIITAVAGTANYQHGTLANVPNAVSLGGMTLLSLVLYGLGRLVPSLGPLLDRLRNGLVLDQSPSTGLKVKTKTLHPTVVTPGPATFVQSADGRILIQDIEQRDHESLHHLSERASECPDEAIREKMLEHLRGLQDAFFTYHHVVDRQATPSSPKLPDSK